jgi:tetratricopeptide (TPR) repeat protein
VLRSLAQAQIERGRWFEAAASLERLLELDTDDEWAQYYLGALMALSQPSVALDRLERAAQSALHGERARALLDVMRSDSDPATLALRAGALFSRADAWSWAELAFQRAADLDPTFAEAWASLGWARAMQGKAGGAYILRAAAQDPTKETQRQPSMLSRRRRRSIHRTRLIMPSWGRPTATCTIWRRRNAGCKWRWSFPAMIRVTGSCWRFFMPMKART